MTGTTNTLSNSNNNDVSGTSNTLLDSDNNAVTGTGNLVDPSLNNDASGSGTTLYVEPQALVEINNRHKQAEITST